MHALFGVGHGHRDQSGVCMLSQMLHDASQGRGSQSAKVVGAWLAHTTCVCQLCVGLGGQRGEATARTQTLRRSSSTFFRMASFTLRFDPKGNLRFDNIEALCQQLNCEDLYEEVSPFSLLSNWLWYYHIWGIHPTVAKEEEPSVGVFELK